MNTVNFYKKWLPLLIAVMFSTTMRGQPLQWEKEVNDLFDNMLNREDIHSGFLLMHSDRLNLHIELAKSDSSSAVQVKPGTPFYLASITKTYTAITIMMLGEKGGRKLEDKIINYLPNGLIDSLHILDGKDYTDEINIHHLLSHTSGLADYFGDEPDYGSNMFMEVLQQSDRFWKAEEIVAFTKNRFTAHFPPGEGFHYSDTGYLLLGLIIQEVTGKKLNVVYSEMVFDPLFMRNSYINLHSKPSHKDLLQMAPIYADQQPIANYNSLSADWGGGGLVSTLGDLLLFTQALNSPGLLSEKSREAMQAWRDESAGTYYGYGLRKWIFKELNPSLPNLTMIGHSGATSSFMYYCPELDTHLIGSFNQTSASKPSIEFLVKCLNTISSK